MVPRICGLKASGSGVAASRSCRSVRANVAVSNHPPAAVAVKEGIDKPPLHFEASRISVCPGEPSKHNCCVTAGDPRAALKARVFLREWFSGKIRLEPLPDGGLMAHWDQNATALLRG